MGKIGKIFIIVLFLIIIAVVISVLWYNSAISAVDKNSNEKVEVKIPTGSTSSQIAEILDNSGVIKSKLAFKIYVKLNKCENFKAGYHGLYKNMDVSEIIKTLQDGKLYLDNKVILTFIEGKNMNWLADKIAEVTNNTKEDVYNLLKNEQYIDSLISKYWFLTEDIKNENIYYPLEGYLFPDTYFFDNKDVKVEEIFTEMLKQTDKVLSEYKEEIKNSKYSIHELLSIGSIIECEAVYDEDRKNVSSVIYNRLDANMPIQSDVTTYYAFKIELGERDLYVSELNTYNPYNTRGPEMNGKLPVGPISSLSKESIDAAINPNKTGYIYFVADKTGKAYFTRTYEEHSNTITELKEQGLWYEF